MAQHQPNLADGLNFWSESTVESSFEVDIFAVQGLGAHPFYTWARKNPPAQKDKARGFWGRLTKKDKARGKVTEPGTESSSSAGLVMWPRDLLVPEFKNARIATYSYGSDWRNRDINTSLRECGQQFLEILLQHRWEASERQRPLILIGHSLGGLVIQQALVIAVHGSKYIDISLSLAGVIFLGTPFQGSDAAVYGNWLASLIRLQQDEGHRYTLLETLKRDSPSLHALSRDFWSSYGDYDVVCFYENKAAQYGPLEAQFVKTHSATAAGQRIIYMDADHSGLNKFIGRDDPNFKLLLPEIRRMVHGAPSVVVDRLRKKDTEPRGNVHWMVPRTVNSLFTGRFEILERIQNAFRNSEALGTKEQKRLVITGLGGQGKSEICFKVANLMREDFWAVFWVDVDNPSTAKNGFIAVSKALGSSVDNIEDSLQALANTKRSWLLILDNADEPNFDYNNYIPSGSQGAVIITSRNPSCQRYSTIEPEALEGLKLKDSTKLLLRAANIPKEAWESCDQQAKDVVELLGSHTLALIQAGAYIAERYCRLEEYPEKFQQQRKRMLKHYPEQEQSRYRNIYATFEASAAVLEHSGDETSKDALDLLATLSTLHSSILPLRAFEDAWVGSRKALDADSTQTDELETLTQWHVSQLPEFMIEQTKTWDNYRLMRASSRLASLSLVTKHQSRDLDGLSMHSLTHAWAKDRLSEKQRQQAGVSAGCVLAFLRDQQAMWEMYERELRPHVRSYLSPRVEDLLSYGPQRMIMPIILECGWTLTHMRDDSSVQSLLDGIYRKLEITPSSPTNEHLSVWCLAAEHLLNMGKDSQAVDLLEHVVNVQGDTLAETHPARLSSQHDLARAYMENGQTNQAVELLQHVVNVRETTLAETELVSSQHELAGAYLQNGQVQEAVELLEHVVKVKASTMAETHPSRLGSQHELARCYLRNGQIQQSVELLEHVVNIHKTTLAETHPEWLGSQHALAGAYLQNGQTTQAVDLLEHVVTIQKTTMAETHPDLLASQHELGRSYLQHGLTKKAVELLEHVVNLMETTLAETHPDRLASQNELAGAYLEDGRTEKAVELLEHIVNVEKTTLSETHLDRLISQHELARAYLENGQVQQAVDLMEHVVNVQGTTLPETHPDRLASQHELAAVYLQNKQIEQGVKLLEHVVNVEKTTLAETHPMRLTSQHELARAYMKNGQIKQAVELQEYVVRLQQTTLAETHPVRLRSERLLVYLLEREYYERDSLE